MAKLTRQEARETLFGLLFETEFQGGKEPAAIYDLACEDREIPNDKYVRESFFGILAKASVLDAVISRYAKGWRADRLSRVSRTVIRIAVYEMLYADDIPANVSISQAVELSVKYGEDRAKQFVNGVLSGFFKDTKARGFEAVVAEALAEKAEKDNKVEEIAEKVETVEEAAEPETAEENA